jgi:hypothetical protein
LTTINAAKSININGLVDEAKCYQTEVYFEGEVEFDEVYVVAGHKGNPEEVKKRIGKEEEIGSKGPKAEAH